MKITGKNCFYLVGIHCRSTKLVSKCFTVYIFVLLAHKTDLTKNTVRFNESLSNKYLDCVLLRIFASLSSSLRDSVGEIWSDITLSKATPSLTATASTNFGSFSGKTGKCW